jgi:hypothetical protein
LRIFVASFERLASLEVVRFGTDSLGLVMKSLTVLLATTILLAGIGASDAAVRIVEDPGGRIETYVDKI